MADSTLTGVLAVVGGVFLFLLTVGALTVYFGSFLFALILMSIVAAVVVFMSRR